MTAENQNCSLQRRAIFLAWFRAEFAREELKRL